MHICWLAKTINNDVIIDSIVKKYSFLMFLLYHKRNKVKKVTTICNNSKYRTKTIKYQKTTLKPSFD